MGRFIVAIDQGTTSSRAVLFDESSAVAGIEQQTFSQHFPRDGWVEHDPIEIWKTVRNTTSTLLKKKGISARGVAALGITNQRETTVIWDRKTGDPVYPAIVWQDRRTAGACEKLRADGLEPKVTEKTGLLLDPYFSATKIAWILDNVDGARRRAENGDLAFGTIDTFLLFKLTDKKRHQTDATNAARTLLFNINDQTWDKELLDIFEIPESLLPTVGDSTDDFGKTSLLGEPVRITAMVGDQQGALVGQCCFAPGQGKITYGTGGFLMVNTGPNVVGSDNRLLSTVGYRLGNRPVYAIEGSIFIAGAAMNWLGENLGFFDSPKQTEALAAAADPNSKVVVVPAFTGLGAPHWNPNVRGGIFGITRDTGIGEIVSATFESIAFQTKDLLLAMEKDGAVLEELRVDGGMARNDGFLKVLANVTGLPVLRQAVVETTVLGAFFLAGLGAGLFDSVDALKKNWRLDKQFDPAPKRDIWDEKYSVWQDRIRRML